MVFLNIKTITSETRLIMVFFLWPVGIIKGMNLLARVPTRQIQINFQYGKVVSLKWR